LELNTAKKSVKLAKKSLNNEGSLSTEITAKDN